MTKRPSQFYKSVEIYARVLWVVRFIGEADKKNIYNENDSILFLQGLCKDEDYFIQRINTNMDATQLITLYDAILNLLADHRSLFELVFRLKKIIRAANSMNASLVLIEAMEKIVDETCECLNCDRATVFIVDEEKEEVWSKVAKGAKTIRIPMSKGIVGFVATKGESVNILDAYQDDRFNKAVDIKMNYKTNTILCSPIFDETKKVVGVIQAINKHNSVFGKDDEGLLAILT